MSPRISSGRPPGRPRLTPEQRAASLERQRLAAIVRSEAARAGRVKRSLFLTEDDAELLERLLDAGGYASAGELVEDLIDELPDPRVMTE